MLTNKGLVEFAKEMVKKSTVYVYGGYGQSLTEAFITYKAKQYPNQNTSTRVTKFKSLLGKGFYGTDCVGLIKGYLWGGVDNLKYNTKQDKSANGMHNAATIKGKMNVMPETPGLLVWMDGHIGIYIGNGEVIECTPKWKDGVQVTKLSQRVWLGWSECPYISYKEEVKETPTKPDTPDSWASEACNWAVKNGLINGDGKDFNWTAPVTKQEMAVILKNYFEKGVDKK